MPKNGFTLIELMVVIAIMALVGAYTLSNFKSFGSDQKLKSAALDVVSLLRQAQTNATTNVYVKCKDQNSNPLSNQWQVKFSSATTIQLECKDPDNNWYAKKVLTFENVAVSGTNALGSDCGVSISSTPTVTFAPVSGNISFTGGTACNSFAVAITFGSDSKSIKIESGGRIYAQ